MSMDINEIMRAIPHRFPMLLVDRVLELEPGVRVVAQKNVSMNENFFAGHYPHYPVMPGVLIIEALAQAGACAILSMEDYKGSTPFFAAIDKCKFRRQVVPGDVLRLEVTMTKLKSAAGIAQAKAYVEGKVAAEAEITFMIQRT
ncbi:MAG: 3-hydroxyacyl-ACP dehydratase FabZ [Defluviitaleaceae bacterium]|nr:3-hydroxyacyl-ACP dehydratase FabZ [Defluviitaleaceae bacterium]